MTKVYISAVVLIPPENLWAPIQAIRDKYDRNFYRWMPHITLLYPFRPESEFNSLESVFKKRLEDIKPFELVLDSFKYFRHGKQRFTMWLEPKPQELVMDLQKKIQSIFPDCDDVSLFKGGFTPHLSLGQIKGSDILDMTLQDLNARWKSLKFIVDRIFLIARERSKNSVFKVKKSISFLKQNPK